MTFDEAVEKVATWMQKNATDGWGESGVLSVDDWVDDARAILDVIGLRDLLIDPSPFDLIQYMVDWADEYGLLEEHCFTFPEGTTWWATGKEPK